MTKVCLNIELNTTALDELEYIRHYLNENVFPEDRSESDVIKYALIYCATHLRQTESV